MESVQEFYSGTTLDRKVEPYTTWLGNHEGQNHKRE